jgi:hypothetical protein
MTRKKKTNQTPAAVPPLRRRRIFGSRSGVVRAPQGSLVVELADATGTGNVVLAALKAAHGWDNETRLTREEFVQARDAWLAAPGRSRRNKRKVTR